MRKVNFHGYTIYEDGSIWTKTGKKIKARDNGGRLEVRLTISYKNRKNYIVSRLVYYVFNEFDIDNKNLCVSYKDGDKTNVHLDNLYLTHRKELIQGDKHHARATLTEDEVTEIRRLYKGSAGANQHNKTSPSMGDLAKQFNTSKQNIKMIVKGYSRNKENYKLK